MKMFLISDNVDTLTGMRLGGVEGLVVHERQELKEALNQVLQDPSYGILLMTEKLSGQFPDVVEDLRFHRSLPLLVEIPDRHGTGRKPDFITDYVREAIGIQL